jgi:hypothetical protein
MVIVIMIAANTQAIAIQSPPKTIHNRLSRKAIGDMFVI